MRVLAIYPAFDLSLNEMAMVWRRVCDTTDTRCTVLANIRGVLKAHTPEAQTEQSGNLQIHRFASLRSNPEVTEIAAGSPFDLIFCAVSKNMDIALQAQKVTGAPIVLHEEYFLDDEAFLRRREYGLPLLRPFFSERKRQRLCREADAILCSNPPEFADPRARKYPRLSYLPWPAPCEVPPKGRTGRRNNSAAYIGSLIRYKGATALFAFFEALLGQEADFLLQIVGPPIDSTGKDGLARLRERFPHQVDVRLHCTREEALLLLSESLFILSPGRRYGWGLIADAWATGTPVLARTEHYDLKDGVNCLVVRTPREFVKGVRRLREDSEIWSRLAAGGLSAIQEHSIAHVAKRLHEAITSIRPRRDGDGLARE